MTFKEMKERIQVAYQAEFRIMKKESGYPFIRPRTREYWANVRLADGREMSSKDMFGGSSDEEWNKGTKKEIQEFLSNAAARGEIFEFSVCGGFDGVENLRYAEDYDPWIGDWDAGFTPEELVSAGFKLTRAAFQDGVDFYDTDKYVGLIVSYPEMRYDPMAIVTTETLYDDVAAARARFLKEYPGYRMESE